MWQLAAFRLLAGIGIGGEWAMGGTFVAEEWPEDRRKAGAGITFLVGVGVSYFHTIGTPVALTSIAFIIGLLLLRFGEETKGKPLPG